VTPTEQLRLLRLPERDLVFDLNDFDEAHPGAWEWDVRRLVASVWMAGRQNGSTEAQCGDAVARCVRAYRDHLANLAEQPLLERAYERVDLDRLRGAATDPATLHEIERAVRAPAARPATARCPGSPRAAGRRRPADRRRPAADHPPDDAQYERLVESLDGYLRTVSTQWARCSAATGWSTSRTRSSGVGSVGLRAYLALCEGSSSDDVLFLQLKQARRSVVARFVHGDQAWHAHQGQRVVEYQKALQTVSDPLLGWTTVGDRSTTSASSAT
jgi:uncharacterized protein (DUF2252 family)